MSCKSSIPSHCGSVLTEELKLTDDAANGALDVCRLGTNKNLYYAVFQIWYFVSKTVLTFGEKKIALKVKDFFFLKFETEGPESTKFLRPLDLE